MLRSALLGWILLASLVLRVLLAFQGGQMFFGDEPRFNRGGLIYRGLLQGDTAPARECLGLPDHAGFTLATTVLTPVQHALAFLTGHGDWSQSVEVIQSLPLGAVLLGLFSVLNLALIHRLALAAGGSMDEADLAALLAAAASSLFFYSRHLVPYDCALTAALGGMVLALTGASRRRELLCGACAGLCYELYNGYWFLVPVVGASLLLSRPDTRARLRALGYGALGGVATIGLVILPGWLISREQYWAYMREFSRTVRQGVFAEGWSLPWAYLWEAEGVLGLGVVAALLWGLFGGRGPERIPTRVKHWLGLAAVLYLLLVLASTGLEKFVVYGRTARTLVPFLCLAGGWALARLVAPHRQWRPVMIAAIVLLAAIRFAPHYSLVFPNEVRSRTWLQLGVTKTAFSFSGCDNSGTKFRVQRPDLALVNAQGLYPLRDYLGYPAGETLFSFPHPAAFGPYLYEGYSPRERRLLRAHGADMRLIRLARPEEVPNTPPPAVTFGPEDVSDGRDRHRL